MEDDAYLALQKESEGMYKEKGSKFLSFAYPVKNEDDVKQKLDSLKKTYFDARHQCYAYILGRDGGVYRSNDDGEPGHSAGDPILGQIRSQHLTNVLIVVIRYYGGTKLGMGGLIQAYRSAASAAILNNEIIKVINKEKFVIEFEHSAMNAIMKMVKEEKLEIEDQRFDLKCRLIFLVRTGMMKKIQEKINSMEYVKILEPNG